MNSAGEDLIIIQLRALTFFIKSQVGWGVGSNFLVNCQRSNLFVVKLAQNLKSFDVQKIENAGYHSASVSCFSDVSNAVCPGRESGDPTRLRLFRAAKVWLSVAS